MRSLPFSRDVSISTNTRVARVKAGKWISGGEVCGVPTTAGAFVSVSIAQTCTLNLSKLLWSCLVALYCIRCSRASKDVGPPLLPFKAPSCIEFANFVRESCKWFDSIQTVIALESDVDSSRVGNVAGVFFTMTEK
jgi:hypothetical protein